MSDTTRAQMRERSKPALARMGGLVLRFGLAAILVIVGAYKFITYEAQGIEPLVANSPLFAWAYHALGLSALSALIGAVEIAIGVAIGSRPFARTLAVAGGIGASVMFLLTLSFLVTTPGVWQTGYGVPFLSAMPGQFIAKDLILLGAAMWTAGDALSGVGSVGSRPHSA